MRWTRPLLLIAILFVLAGVGATFYSRLKDQSRDSPNRPASLPEGTAATSHSWSYTKTDKSKPVVYVHADDYEESGGKLHMTGVELHLFHKEATQFDLVKSAKADFDTGQGLLFSDGEVEITMGVPAASKDDKPTGRLMQIKSSGVTFESKTGKASTDRATTFAFDQGGGQAVGATYDPQTHELHLSSQVKLEWRGRNPKAKPMHVEAGDVTYREKEAKIFLGQWSKLFRDTLTLNAGPATVALEAGVIRQVDTDHAVGTDIRPTRHVEYAADKLTMHLDDDGEIQQIVGEQNARLVSESDTARTTITTDRVDLAFNTETRDSILDTALATGHSVAESKPIWKPQSTNASGPPDTRILRSDVIKTKMRPDGQEIDNVETASAGSLEFLPNKAGQPHRWMNGDRMWIQYGIKNQIESFRSVNVSTRTVKPKAKDAKVEPPPSLTWSKDLTAQFDPKTSQLSKLEQWNDFRYEEGTRKAKANRAVLEQGKNLINLSGTARVWDQTGSTEGETIVLDQKSGDFTAEGNVNSTRLPDRKPVDPKADKTPAKVVDAKAADAKPQSAGMLSDNEPMHAKANKMSSTDSNLQIRYEGNAVAWQSANRLQADVIEIDRENNIVKAHGNVVSQLLDKADEPKADPAKPAPAPDPKVAKKAKAPPVFTIVKSPELVYNDDDKLAHYTGGVILDRPSMRVKSRELRAFLRDSANDSSLDHAFADGKVEIVQTAVDRTRTGTSEHAEYYVDEAKVILETGRPQLVDSLKGTTQGRKLTWFSNDDRLLVDGETGQPAKSKLRRK